MPMPAYHIQNKIRTVSEVFMPTEVRGFRFEAYELEDGMYEPYWIAARTLEASNAKEAFQRFRQELSPIIDCLSVLTQCSFSLIGTSFLIRRIGENPHGDFYAYLARPSQPVGIGFWSDEQKHDLEILLAEEEIHSAIHYMRDAINASTAKTRLAMLVIVAESLAGTATHYHICTNCKTRDPYDRTNLTKVEEILGQDVYRRLYKKNAGSLRHKLFHGRPVSDEELGDLPSSAYDAIIEYLRKTFQLDTLGEIVAAPRTFDGFEHGAVFVRPDDPEKWDLQRVEKETPTAPGLQILPQVPENY